MAVKTHEEKVNNFYKRFFLFAAVWNLGAGLMGVLSLTFNIKLFYNIDNYSNDGLFKLHYYNFWAFILIMGIGFYFVSRDIAKNYAMAIVGVLGKTLAIIIWVYYYYLGEATFMVLVAGGGDMVIVIAFIIYLRFTIKEAKKTKVIK